MIYPPQKRYPQKNSPHDNCPHGKLTTLKIPHSENSPQPFPGEEFSVLGVFHVDNFRAGYFFVGILLWGNSLMGILFCGNSLISLVIKTVERL